MRSLWVVVIIVALGVTRPGQAQEEVALGGILAVIIAPVLVPLGTLAVSSPFLIASAVEGRTARFDPRPVSGAARMQGIWPSRDERALFFHLDFGGVPPKGSTLGWEGRCDLMAYPGWTDNALYIRWDGLGLWSLGERDARGGVELLGGWTVWPTLSDELDVAWTLGGLGGVRAGRLIGGAGVVRAEAELLGVAFGGAGASGLDAQLEARASLSLHLPWRVGKPVGSTGTGIGLAYRGQFPLGEAHHVPRAHFLLWNVVF